MFWIIGLACLAALCAAALVWDRRNRRRGRTFGGGTSPDLGADGQAPPWKDFGAG